MAKERIKYNDIYVQALTKEIPCVDSGIIQSFFKKVLFSAQVLLLCK